MLLTSARWKGQRRRWWADMEEPGWWGWTPWSHAIHLLGRIL